MLNNLFSLWLNSSEVIIHSGCTQEYYSNRIDLDDHAEDTLSFVFGVKSLVGISLEYIIENTPAYFTRSNLAELPLHLHDIIYKRIDEDLETLYPYTQSPISTTNPLLNRTTVLHRGI